MKQIVNANISYLIHLIGCALDNTIPEELPQDVTWKDIYQLAKYHSINILYFIVLKNWQKSQMKNCIKNGWNQETRRFLKG